MGEDILFGDKPEPPGSSLTHEFSHQNSTNVQVISSNSRTQFLSTVFISSCGHDNGLSERKEHGDSFRQRWYPQVTQQQWLDWRWQLRNRITSYDQLNAMFQLSGDEKQALDYGIVSGLLPVAITPYYASLIDVSNSEHALRKIVIPVISETIQSKGEAVDPLSEHEQSPLPNLVHRYPDRVLFLTTNLCASYCRYCTRSRMVGICKEKHAITRAHWEKAIEYIKQHTEVRDVLLSGGDPLMLADSSIEWLLQRLRSIDHVEIIRIGTRVPVVLPQRITDSLVQILKKYHPLWMSIHFTHYEEITEDVKQACCKLSDAGIPLGSQTVLLAGINDSVEVLKKMFHGLLKIRVRPYYLYQCDPIVGSSHFRTSVSKGINIIKQLRGFTSGYAIPNYVIDAPGGGGKVLVSPDYILGYEGDTLLLSNFENKVFGYVDNGV